MTEEMLAYHRERRRNRTPEQKARDREYNRQWRARNKDRVKEHARRHHQKHRAKRLAEAKAYGKANRERLRVLAIKRQRERMAADPRFRLDRVLRGRLYNLTKRKGRICSASLKLDKAALVAHLGAQFKPGMTWANHGTVWHIDHIRPCASFDLTNPAQVHECFALSNLQPLWARENIQKSDRLDWPKAA